MGILDDFSKRREMRKKAEGFENETIFPSSVNEYDVEGTNPDDVMGFIDEDAVYGNEHGDLDIPPEYAKQGYDFGIEKLYLPDVKNMDVVVDVVGKSGSYQYTAPGNFEAGSAIEDWEVVGAWVQKSDEEWQQLDPYAQDSIASEQYNYIHDQLVEKYERERPTGPDPDAARDDMQDRMLNGSLGILRDFWKRNAVDYDNTLPEDQQSDEWNQARDRRDFYEGIPGGDAPTAEGIPEDLANKDLGIEPDVFEYADTHPILMRLFMTMNNGERPRDDQEFLSFLERVGGLPMTEDMGNRIKDLDKMEERIKGGGSIRVPERYKQKRRQEPPEDM